MIKALRSFVRHANDAVTTLVKAYGCRLALNTIHRLRVLEGAPPLEPLLKAIAIHERHELADMACKLRSLLPFVGPLTEADEAFIALVEKHAKAPTSTLN